MNPKKHTYRELENKLKQAQEAFEAGRYVAADGDKNRHIAADMAELDLTSQDDYWDLVYECIQLALEDPLSCSRSKSQKSTKHKSTRNLPMWAFKVFHPVRNQDLYFKFCLKNASHGTRYLHIDCHADRY
jgi:hypothetical protein